MGEAFDGGVYCAGKSAPVERSPVFFESMAEAAKEGKKALGRFLAKRGGLRSLQALDAALFLCLGGHRQSARGPSNALIAPNRLAPLPDKQTLAMPRSLADNLDHWRQRGEKMRTTASTMEELGN